MNTKRTFLLAAVIFGSLLLTGLPLAFSQTTTSTPVIDSLVTSFSYPAAQPVTPLFKFGHIIGGDPAKPPASAQLTVNYSISPPRGIDDPPVSAVLLEDNTRVAAAPYPFPLTYTPTSPGTRTLVVVLSGSTQDDTTSAGVVIQMYGTKLQTSLGIGVVTPFMPFTSQIFLEADSSVIEGNIKLAQFFHRSLPFQLTTGVPYTSADKTLSNGKLFQPLISITYQPGTTPPNVDTVGDTTASNNVNYKYVGPRLVNGVDYYNYKEPTDETVVLPNSYPAPPRGLADLVISKDNGMDDNVYQVIIAGRLDPAVTVPSLATTGGVAVGILEFTFTGNPLLPGKDYLSGELVLSNGRIYEVVQAGKTPADLGPGLLQTDGQVATLGTAAFNFIPSKVLKEQLAYWKDDLVISNGHIYRVSIGGTIAVGKLGTGLHSLTADVLENKEGAVTFQMVGAPFDPATEYSNGMLVSNNGRIYKVNGPEEASATNGTAPISTDPYVKATFASDPNFSFQLVLPQFQRYSQINSDYAGVSLQQSVVYHAGDFVVSNGKVYQVIVGGTMGPVGGGLMSVDTQTLGGLTFKYVSVFTKQISTIHPFADVPFPYSSFDYSFPYTLKWSPADTVSNQYSWFGTAGYFETHTNLELVTRTTDSKDQTNISSTVPVSILPPIDARAAVSLSITSPDPSRLIAAGTTTQITAEAKDVDGTVRFVNSVQFFVDGVPLYAPDATFPYTTEDPHWIPTIAGTYILNALAVDDKGNYTISPDIRVNVTDNQPFVTLTSPDAGDPFNPIVIGSGQSIEIAGIASGSGGDPTHITSLEFFSDGNSIGTGTVNSDGTFSFSYVVANASSGPINYQITARVTDTNGATANSNSIYIQVTTTGPNPSPTPIAVPVVQFIQGSVTVNSLQPTASLGVTLLRPAGDTDAVSVSYSTRDGTALAGRDYVGQSGTIVFSPGEVSKTIEIPLIAQALPTDRTFSVSLSNPSRGVIGIPPTEFVTITSVDLSTKVTNISTRGPVQTGDSVMIAGFIVTGDGNKQVVARGIGPSLTAAGVVGAMSDPTLTLMDANGTQIGYNDDYTGAPAADQGTLVTYNLTPSDTRESAIVADLAVGNYTAILRGKTNGVGLVEIYDISDTRLSHFVNISTRAKVEQTDSGAVIAGFIIQAPQDQA
ncbi:MAG: hypothetical protein H0U23_10905, partial [Blastocatellia bacterium]|nr:hypothetical protein [Blastocatellia bacterium]